LYSKMSLQMTLLSIVSVVAGFAVALCSFNCTNRKASNLSKFSRVTCSMLSVIVLIAGILGLVYCFRSPPLFSVEVSGPPSYSLNDPERSIYLGNGCFWHTQYDFVVLEQDPLGVFGGRSDAAVTSLAGYAGGRYQSHSGNACYHGLPHTDYSRMGHAEAVSVTLNASSGSTARAQVAAIAAVYFEHGFKTVDEGRGRLDTVDTGAEYRNVIGLPGGMDNVEFWPIIAAANVHGMPLIRGTGGTADDTEDEYVVYVYDSREYPFFRAEAYHQFHANSVIKRSVPSSYTEDLYGVQDDLGRLYGTGCVEWPSELVLLIAFLSSLFLGLGSVFLYVFFLSKVSLNDLQDTFGRAKDHGRPSPATNQSRGVHPEVGVEDA